MIEEEKKVILADRLYERLYINRGIHEMCATLEHAIKEANIWKPYIPTHFIYAFFTFNNLYSIDWENSLRDDDYSVFSNEEYTESFMINKYISFCCQDRKFLSIYNKFFIKYVVGNNTIDEILNELQYIEIDKNPNGGIKSKEQIDKFITSCSNCLKGIKFNKYNISNIIFFIYKIRCNLFHGTKDINKLKDPRQQRRLNIYTSIIIAMNQMAFSYLQYSRGDNITEGFDRLLKRLEWKPIQPTNRSNRRLEIEE